MDSGELGSSFPGWLKDELAKPGRSQSALARHMGLDASAVNRLVNGLRELKYREMEKIREYLQQTGGVDERGYNSLPVRAIADMEIRRQAEDRAVSRYFNRLRLFVSMGDVLIEALENSFSRGLEDGRWTLTEITSAAPRTNDYARNLLSWNYFLERVSKEEFDFARLALDLRDAATVALRAEQMASGLADEEAWRSELPDPFPSGELRERAISALRQFGRSEIPDEQGKDAGAFDVVYAAISSTLAMQLIGDGNDAARAAISELNIRSRRRS